MVENWVTVSYIPFIHMTDDWLILINQTGQENKKIGGGGGGGWGGTQPKTLNPFTPKI